MRKKLIISICILLCLNAFFLPFLFATIESSNLEIIAVSFTAFGSVASVITLIIALLLYQKFGLESKFMERKTDKVLELVDLLKGKVITAETDKLSYYVRTNKVDLERFKKDPTFREIFEKEVLLRFDDNDKSMNKIVDIKKSYWLPTEIKENLNFLEIKMTLKVDNPMDRKYARFNYGNISEDVWSTSYPKYTVESYIKKQNKLVDSIERWLKMHSEITIDLNLDEENQKMKMH